MGPLNGFSWKFSSLFHCPYPDWFLQSGVTRIYLHDTGTLGCVVWPEAGIALSKGIPPDFYPPHMNVGLPVPLLLPPLCTIPCLCASPPASMTLPILPVWMNVASLNPWLLDFNTACFSDSSGCYLFWDIVVILFVIAWEGEACLPIPPFWLEVLD